MGKAKISAVFIIRIWKTGTFFENSDIAYKTCFKSPCPSIPNSLGYPKNTVGYNAQQKDLTNLLLEIFCPSGLFIPAYLHICWINIIYPAVKRLLNSDHSLLIRKGLGKHIRNTEPNFIISIYTARGKFTLQCQFPIFINSC